MRKNKENELKLIKAMQANVDAMYHFKIEQGDEQEAENILRQSIVFDEVIWLLTDKNYFNELCNIFLNE